MTVPSNLYAEKIFSEHPIGLWAFDDQADYISLISEAQRDLTDWTVDGGSVSVDTSITDIPFDSSIVNFVEGDVPSGAYNEIIFTSNDLYNFEDMNSYYGTFAIGAYVYIDSAFTESISIGYEYTDSTSLEVIENVVTKTFDVIDEWVFISGTFNIENENADIRPLIKIKTTSGGSSTSDYQYYVNGITVGQWSEEFNATSLGVSQITFPSGIALNETNAVEAQAYGITYDPAYYIVSDGALLAKNTSIPMVYGASGVTKLIPNDGPSIIFPGKGFLNKVGQFNEYTVEFWARINSDTKDPKRIFGPIASADGLYVESGFLSLVVGKKFVSHFIGEWFRPMLIDIRLIRNSISVLINGEEVMSMTIDTDTLDLPDEYSIDNKSQDWLGIYTYDEVFPIEIDCVAIYPYQVSTTLAKRRYVYGQGVLSPEGINSAYSGTTAFVDYSFADYTANYSYPSFTEWTQGSFDNLAVGDLTLSTPSYNLPEISIGSKIVQELYDDNQSIQSGTYKFITFRPNSGWNSTNAYFNFNNFNVLSEEVRSIYGVFSNNNISSEFTLFKIYNKINGNYFIVKQDQDEIKYSLYFNGTTTLLYTSDAILSNDIFAAGINIVDLSERFGGNVSSFFGNINGLEIYVAGDNDNQTFTGKIYSFGLSTSANALGASAYFEDGFAILNSGEDLIDFTASYTLLPIEAYSSYFLDIGIAGYWEDYLPLSYFGQFVTDQEGSDYYDLDFLQFNIGYPSPSSLKELETTTSWTYGELKTEYGHPVVKTYGQLDNALLTGWNDYQDLSEKAVKFYEYDTAGSAIRSYVTFQYVEDGANLLSSNFTIEETLKEGGVIDLQEYSNWSTTRFNVIDNTIIYPRKNIDFNNIAIVYRVEFNVRGILTKPLSLRKLEIASQSFNDNSFNPVGTKFGINLFPYKRAGIYFDYKSKNPFSIYKGSTPYLYLNRNSGIQVRGEFDPDISRGISMPINTGLAPEYSVSAFQMWMRYDQDLFPGTPQELFEIDYIEDRIKFYFVANSELGNRARIYAKSESTGQEYNSLTYFLNGIEVSDPILTAKEWSVLGIRLDDSLSFNAYLGSLNLTGPMVFNNIAYYQANNLERVQSIKERPWIDIKIDYTTDPDTQFTWADWWGPNTGDEKNSWLTVLVTGTLDFYGVNPSVVYKTYLGTNKIILDDNEGFEFADDEVRVYSDVLWQTSNVVAV